MVLLIKKMFMMFTTVKMKAHGVQYKSGICCLDDLVLPVFPYLIGVKTLFRHLMSYLSPLPKKK